MKTGSLLFISLFAFTFFQYGCKEADNSNQLLPASNQNLNVASVNSSPSAVNSESGNSENNGASEAQVRGVLELLERCKHTPTRDAKATPITGKAPLKVTFDGSPARDPDGTKIVKWRWNFGTKEFKEGKIVTHIFEKPGIYGFGLDATDAQGQKTSDCYAGANDIQIIVTE